VVSDASDYSLFAVLGSVATEVLALQELGGLDVSFAAGRGIARVAFVLV